MAIAAIDDENVVIMGGREGRKVHDNVHVFNVCEETIVWKKEAKLVHPVRAPLAQVDRGIFLLSTREGENKLVEYEFETGISKLVFTHTLKFESQRVFSSIFYKNFLTIIH